MVRNAVWGADYETSEADAEVPAAVSVLVAAGWIVERSLKYYNFQTRRLTSILTLKQDPVPFIANLAASRDGRTVFFVQGEPKNSVVMVEHFQ